ncbi:MAG: ribonuclease P protein component [Holosporaceae bacterium]|nr:ribonuclease P protein component [Holosporaceae bacterium]
MKKEFRIKKRRDFVKVSKSGFYFRTSSLVVCCGLNGLETYRVGFTASKRVGNAVVRNRCKRRMRAAADIVFDEAGLAGVDYVMIAKKSAFNVKWDVLLKETASAARFLNDKIKKCGSF